LSKLTGVHIKQYNTVKISQSIIFFIVHYLQNFKIDISVIKEINVAYVYGENKKNMCVVTIGFRAGYHLVKAGAEKKKYITEYTLPKINY